MFRDLKYLAAYLIPFSACMALYFKGIHSYSTVLGGFVLLPLLEMLFTPTTHNFPEEQEPQMEANRIFDWMLYLNVPIVYGVLAWFCWTLVNVELATYEVVGLTLSVGILVGVNGINVAHELGHRSSAFEQFLAKMLLTPALYLHFTIEHNLGHHKYVATERDPATARFGEPIYTFWFRAVAGVWKGAWALEKRRLERAGKSVFSVQNQMFHFILIHIAYLVVMGLVFSWAVVFPLAFVGIVAFSLLEAINYVEHYGLLRQKLPSGRHEPVSPIHSWNSNHEIGRIFLYELTRHSDHHFKATRKYQVLRHHDESPQLPYGYPASVVMALVPPLWFSMMNPRARRFRKDL